MKQIILFLRKPYRWAAVYGTALCLFFAFVQLDAFVIPRAQMQVAAAEPPTVQSSVLELEQSLSEVAGQDETEAVPEQNSVSSAVPANPVITPTSYEDENIKITIETVREYDTTFYVADILLSDPTQLKTAFAQNVYGRNIKETTSEIADSHNAIFAINGDYYGFRDNGYVLRNGVLYRDVPGADTLVIDQSGNFSIADEAAASAATLLEQSAWQAFSFGPVLVEGGEIAVDIGTEVSGKSKNSNPRTAIGQAGALHYICIVSDGRTSSSAGLSLYQLAQEFAERGCTVAYNLDGGGSSSMVFNGEILNNPVNGRKGGEREVSDIVYIGYA